MKFSELKGKAVVNFQDAKKIGEIHDLYFDPNSQRIAGLDIKEGGLFGHTACVPATDIRSIGPDAVMVSPAVEQADKDSFNPQGLQSLADVANDKVVTDTGALVGQVSDVLIDPGAMAVVGYEIGGNGLFSKPRQFPATPQIRYGDELITIPEQLLNQPVQNPSL